MQRTHGNSPLLEDDVAANRRLSESPIGVAGQWVTI
jgi:hypothetical protein